jgi:hypothetical protein
MARVPEVASEKIALARCIHCCLKLPFATSLAIYIYTHEGVDISYGYRYYQMMPRVNIFFCKNKKR